MKKIQVKMIINTRKSVPLPSNAYLTLADKQELIETKATKSSNDARRSSQLGVLNI